MRTWFITGVSRGLGKALAQTALGRGDAVIGTSRDGIAPDIDAGTGQLRMLPLEIADPGAADAVAARAYESADRIDVVVNNAGYGLLGPIEAANDADVARLFEVNVFGPFRLIRAFLPHLRRQGSGHIVNVTSVAGRAPTAGSGLYAAAKSAMEGLSQSLAQEVAPFGIKVMAVALGGFRTDFLSDRSIRRSGGGLDDLYAETVGKTLAHLDGIAGRQIGDPARGAETIVAALEAIEPPMHLLLGSDALRRARAKLGATTAEIDRWEALTLGTDHPDGERA